MVPHDTNHHNSTQPEKRLAVSAIMSQMKSVARESATAVSFSLKIATKPLRIVNTNIMNVNTRALMGERRLK